MSKRADGERGADPAQMEVDAPLPETAHDARPIDARRPQLESAAPHPSIVPVYEVARDDTGAAYFTMRKVDGIALDEVLRRKRNGDRAPSLDGASYVAPEQAARDRIDPRADVFTLGVILYEIVAGKPLFAGDARFSLVLGNYDARPSALAGSDTAPPELDAICTRATAYDPAGLEQIQAESRAKVLALSRLLS
jgi:hypothetical protein